MKFGRKLLIAAKGIGLWWGIYLILCCCAGFALKMIDSLFMVVTGTFEVKLYIPIILAGSLVLAIITYFITALVRLAPKKMLSGKLRRILKKEGFSDNLIFEILSNAKGEMKNYMLTEAATVYCITGRKESALDTLKRVDLISVLDIAQSTGDFRTAAYYYCTKMTLCVLNSDKDGAAKAYDEGIYYLEAFSSDDRVLTVLALYQTEGALYNSAVDTLKKIKWHSLPVSIRKYGRAICAVITSVNLANLEKYDDAIFYAEMAKENTCSEYMTKLDDDVISRSRSGKRSSALNAQNETAEIGE
ncbi:MAG: hypothetical protein K2H23_01205 [Oscillospiraceae bacterium]|nr:hypothetical protein [Oscillospiraceae bacterium]